MEGITLNCSRISRHYLKTTLWSFGVLSNECERGKIIGIIENDARDNYNEPDNTS